MEVSYELTLEDLRAYLEWGARQSPTREQFERSRVLGTAVFVVIAAIFALGSLLGSGTLLTVVGFICLLAAMLVWFTLPGRLVSTYARRAIAAMSSGKVGYVVGPRVARIDVLGLAVSGPGLALSYAWQLVDHVAFSAAGVYVFLGAQQAHVIPRSAFASYEELRRFAEDAEVLRTSATATPRAAAPR